VQGRPRASDYRDLVVAWRNNSAVRLTDVSRVIDSVEDTRTLGLFNGEPAVIVLLRRQPGANVIETVDSVRALLPALQAQLPGDVLMRVASDRTLSIRSSLHEIELTLAISVVLVVLVVGLFLRTLRATIIPVVATLVSLAGTFGAMYAMGFSLNNLSLMALTVATGFVVDDAIVVLENTTRHIEAGMDRFKAALLGAREVGFTVLSISVSLVAVFIPLLFMGGQVGRLFREFALTLSAAVMISLVISLTTTPMMCAWLLKSGEQAKKQGRLSRFFDRSFGHVQSGYARSLDWALDNSWIVMFVLASVVALNVWLFIAAPKGFFPQQDTGQLNGGLRADQSISFQATQEKLKQLVDIIRRDPAVDTVTGFTGGGRAGGGFFFVTLKSRPERKEGGQAVIARLRPQMAQVSGVSLFLSPVQDVRMGGRQSNATYQYALQSDNLADLRKWSGLLAAQMRTEKALTDIDSDQQDSGVETFIEINHDAASRYGLTSRDIDNALYNAFGQRQVATVYDELNQYKVVMEVDPIYAKSPAALSEVYVPVRSGSIPTTTAASGTLGSNAAPAGTVPSATASGSANPGLRDPSAGQAVNTGASLMVPLSEIASWQQRATAAAINHQDAGIATTISFNLVEGVPLSEAKEAIRRAENAIGMPSNVRGSFQGTAKAFEQSQGSQGLLIAAALIVIYIVLGVLYESMIHPLTVLSTLPSAGVGAVIALLMFNMEFSIIALIGVFLLIGIVKKNAILIIDFALDAERARGISARQAVREACLLRFRPILMTTLAAALGALPLAIGFGDGAELRRPLGVAIIGGLIASQVLTLLTTPVVYLLLDRLRGKRDEADLARHPVTA
jgi:multidrug efflux pump